MQHFASKTPNQHNLISDLGDTARLCVCRLGEWGASTCRPVAALDEQVLDLLQGQACKCKDRLCKPVEHTKICNIYRC